jgi:hypothetical protein
MNGFVALCVSGQKICYPIMQLGKQSFLGWRLLEKNGKNISLGVEIGNIFYGTFLCYKVGSERTIDPIVYTNLFDLICTDERWCIIGICSIEMRETCHANFCLLN